MSLEGQSAGPANAPPYLLRERYEVGERVAEGTFFLTHRARDTQTGRAVAVKVLRPEYAADEPFANRLAAESRSAVTLQHPSISQIYDVFRHQGTVVIITEWVRGMNLQDRIRRVAPFPLAVAVDILQACADALHQAHESGFIHGDIRPDNIIITPDGRVKITDFGVGASAAATTRIQLGALQRTAFYLAPEVAQGHAPDARTDIYSLGVVMYEMLTGSVPYTADTPLATAVKHLNEPVPSPKDKNHAVPNAVDGITRKCLQKDPMARYLSLTALLQDVRAVQDALRNDRPLTWSPLKEAPESVPTAEKTRTRLAAAPPRRSPAPPHEPEPDSGPSLKLLAGVGLLGLLMIGLFFGAVTMFTSAPKVVTVPPNIVGLQQAQAEAELAKLGLKPEIRQDFRPDVDAGNVFDTAPPPGTDLRAGKSVILYVSKGVEPVTVPDVTGKTLAQAQQALATAGLSRGTTSEEYSEVIEKGQVISQSPVGGSESHKKGSVNLVISKGPEPVREPTPSDVNPDEGVPAPKAFGGDTNPVPSPDLPQRDMTVTVGIPRTGTGPQRVAIIVHNEDGTQTTAYEQEHQPGETIEPVVTVSGHEGKCEIEVQINGKVVRRTKV